MVMAVPGTFEYFRSLGNILVLKGFCTENDIVDAVTQQANETNGTKPLLGDVLVDMGICTDDQIAEALVYQDEVEIKESMKKRDEATRKLERAIDADAAKIEVILKEG